MILSDAVSFALIFLVGFLLAASLAPLGALGWWAGWYGRNPEDMQDDATLKSEPVAAQHFVIFLTGIHSVSGETFARREINFLECLKERLTDTVMLEVFPYSVNNQALTGQRFFAWFWRLALRLKFSRLAFAGIVINLRNVFQVAVSADKRYGPIYNQGMAETIVESLQENGYVLGSGTPIKLIGYSGGGQIAVGAIPYLKDIVNAPITVVSLGGIMCADPGILVAEKIYHLKGQRDNVQRIGEIIFPGRWAALPYSSWNQAKHEGTLEIIDMGRVDHTGKEGYLDSKFMLPDGRSSFEQTVDIVVDLLERH